MHLNRLPSAPFSSDESNPDYCADFEVFARFQKLLANILNLKGIIPKTPPPPEFPPPVSLPETINMLREQRYPVNRMTLAMAFLHLTINQTVDYFHDNRPADAPRFSRKAYLFLRSMAGPAISYMVHETTLMRPRQEAFFAAIKPLITLPEGPEEVVIHNAFSGNNYALSPMSQVLTKDRADSAGPVKFICTDITDPDPGNIHAPDSGPTEGLNSEFRKMDLSPANCLDGTDLATVDLVFGLHPDINHTATEGAPFPSIIRTLITSSPQCVFSTFERSEADNLIRSIWDLRYTHDIKLFETRDESGTRTDGGLSSAIFSIRRQAPRAQPLKLEGAGQSPRPFLLKVFQHLLNIEENHRSGKFDDKTYHAYLGGLYAPEAPENTDKATELEIRAEDYRTSTQSDFNFAVIVKRRDPVRRDA